MALIGGWEGYPHYFRFRGNREFILDEIINHYIYLAKPSQLNDPFDCYFGLIEIPDDSTFLRRAQYEVYKNQLGISRQEAREMAREAPLEEILSLYSDAVTGFIEKMGVSSFAVAPSNLAMWYSYADNHQGVCIQYDARKDNFFKSIKPVEYKSEFKKVNITDSSSQDFKVFSEKAAEHLFFSKSTAWESEKEFRVVGYSGKAILSPESMTRVLYGINCDEDFIKEVMVRN